MTLRRILTWAVMTTAFTVAEIPLRAGQAGTSATAAVITNNPEIQKSLDRLQKRSAVWRNALAEVEKLGRKAVVVTPKNVRVKDPKNGKLRSFDRDVLAEVQPLAEHETRVDAVVVVINVALLERMLASTDTVGDFEDDLDRVVAHEVYGHAIPYLLAGDLSGKCADPVPGQRAEDACAIKRENEIRAELRLGERRDYGLNGLAMARRSRH
ncbi:MAG TPA: hypothetical protein VNT81_17220 [Vicinamibacterales bacterium]|nr:hypothetical protein [Vicinamibacterales bacterium]